MAYVIIVIETQSDFPGVEACFGPFETWEEANEERARASRLTLADTDDHVQVAKVDKIRDPL
jgi:hypothetical protein